MNLTSKQEKFAQCVADGMNQSDAYRAAYSAGGMKDNSVNVNASKLMADAKVSLRVTELRKALADKALWTREDSVLTLAAIARNGESKAGEIVSAIKELNLMHGFNAPLDINLGGKVISVIERRIVKAG
jgi:phage terminase small subunit